jgi:hypothetical protein
MHRSSQKLTLKIEGEMVIFALIGYLGKTNGENGMVIVFLFTFYYLKSGFFIFISLFYLF